MINNFTQSEKTNERTPISPKAFDMEYATQFRKEMEWLKGHGFEPTFTKRTPGTRIPTYKYTKTPELFRCVAEFYENRRNEKQYTRLTGTIEVAKALSLDDEADETI